MIECTEDRKCNVLLTNEVRNWVLAIFFSLEVGVKSVKLDVA